MVTEKISSQIQRRKQEKKRQYESVLQENQLTNTISHQMNGYTFNFCLNLLSFKYWFPFRS